MKFGGLELVCGRPILALGFALVHQTKQLLTTKRIKQKQKAKQAAGIEGQVATMLESHTRETDTAAQFLPNYIRLICVSVVFLDGFWMDLLPLRWSTLIFF